MAKSFISERIKFRNDKEQVAFIAACVDKLGGTNKVASLLSISERTIRDWKKAKFSIPYSSALILSKKTKIPFPFGIKEISLVKHLQRIALSGGVANYRTNRKIGGDETKRKDAWKAWWVSSGKISKNLVSYPMEVHLPKKSELLAEFFGIMLGDGGVAPYHTSITLNATRDAAYAHFVERLLFTLFKVRPKLYKRKDKDALAIILHRKAIVQFCISLGLPLGNKLRKPVPIPDWIIQNSKYSYAFIRGLVDTDGCVFIHKYRVKGKMYSYVKIGFSSASPALLDTVYEILNNSAIRAKKKYTFREIRIENTEFVDKYMRVVGSHNPKHIAVWKNHRRGV